MAGYLFLGHHNACDVQMASNILCLIFHSRDRCVLVQSLSSFGPVLHVKGLSCWFPLRFLSSRVQGKRNQLYFAVSSSLSLRNGMHRLLYLQVKTDSIRSLKLEKQNLLQLLLLFPWIGVAIVNNCLSFLPNIKRSMT